MTDTHREPSTRPDESAEAEGKPPALRLEGVRKSYGSVHALKATDLTVSDGEIVTLLGPSGSGKSTILSIAAGITESDGGRVMFHGEDYTHRPMHQRGVGMVFQRYTLFPNKTVAENVAFPLQVRRMPREDVAARVERFLGMVSLTTQADRYPSQISGGQAQRVALARALVFEPGLLLMDEPLGALDRRLRQDLQEEIRRIQQATGVPTLYVTHDQEEAMNLSDRIVVVRDGSITASGRPRDLYRNPSTLWNAAFLGDVNAQRVVSLAPRADGLADARTESGLNVVARMPNDVAAGGAHVVVRPEQCTVAQERPATENAYRGIVVGATYLGTHQRVDVRLDQGWEVRAAVSGECPLPGPGQEVYCGWDPDAALIVAG